MPLDQLDIGTNQVTPEKEMSFLDHLEELRWHIVRSVIAVGIIGIITFIAKDFVFGTIVLGPTQADFVSYDIICSLIKSLPFEANCLIPPEFNFITPVFGEPFILHIKVSIVLGLIFSFPYIFWEFWRFISPGLYEEERKAARGVVFICSFLFLSGVLFGYYVIAPFAVTFLMSYELPGLVQATPSYSSYVNYLTLFTGPAGLVFQLPVVVYFLAKVGLITPEFMRTYRRHAIVGILLLSATITPPDVMTQFLIGIPLYVLYEISIIICKRVTANAAAKEE